MNRIESFIKKQKRLMLHLAFALLMIGGSWQHASAQVDPHFSQYYIYPMALNPALTGTMDGDYRVSAIWRSQYSNTLTTRGISADMITEKNTNFGFNLLNQATNDKSYNFTNAYATMSYTGVRFGKQGYHYLALALQCGVLNRRFDVSKLQFGSQWASGLGYDPSMSSGETFTKPSMYAFDAGVGAAYFDATPGKKVNLYGGVSAFHITRPKNTFLSAGSEDQVLPVRYSVHGGARITVSDSLTLVPNVLYVKQGQAEEKMIGTYAQLYVSETVDVMVGGNWRMQDAIVPFAGFYYKGFTLGVSYDVNASKMSAASNRSNSFELSLSFVGKSKKEMKTRPFYCPRF
ncbi:MAG: PorP/SprF family type IX secretion system membrane protein [Chitinophagaceae bacterium]